MKRHLVLGTILTAITSGWILLINLSLTPFLINHLGKEAYGVWVLMTSFAVTTGFLSLLDFGIQGSVVKFIAEYYAQEELDAIDQIVSAGLYIFSTMGLLGACFLGLFAWLLFEHFFNIPPSLVDIARMLLYLLAIQTIIEFPGLIFSAILEGLQQFVLLRIITIVQMGLYAGSIVGLIFQDYGLIAMGITMLVLSILRVCAMVYLARRLLPNLRLVRHFDRGMLRKVAGFSGQLFLIRIQAVIYNQMDKIIIGAMLTSTMLTDYDIANKVRMLVMMSLSLITPQIVAPASHLDSVQDRTRLQDLFLKGTKYSLAISLPVATSAFVLAEAIIRVWIGPEYTYNAGIARLFVSYLFIVAIIDVGQNVMFGVGQIKSMVWISCITTGINLAVSITLTPRIGVAGVIWGTIAGTTLAMIPYLWLYLQTLHISIGQFIREVLLPTYPMAIILGILLFIGQYVVILDNLWKLAGLGIIGMGMYGFMLISFGLTSQERKTLLSAVTSRM